MDIKSLFDPEQAGKFPDPFLTPSRQFIPTSLDSALDFSLMLYHQNENYRRASIRVVSHFITDLDVKGTHSGSQMSKANKDDYYDLLLDTLGLFQTMQTMGQDWSCFGNSYYRMHYPFNRYLQDSRQNLRCYALSAFPEHLVKYDWKSLEYEVPDPLNPKVRVKLPFIDRVSTDVSGLRLQPIDPKYIFILASHISGKLQYVYKFEPWFVQEVRQGVVHQVNETPRDMLEALSQDKDFRFDEGQLFHFKAPTVCGLNNKGWGIPETLLNYRNIHQLAVYRKIDEQLGEDYMMPFRLFSPNFGTNTNETMLYNNMGVWTERIQSLIANRRKDPSKMAAFPFPVNYQEFGAEGKNLVPKDLIEYQDSRLLDGMGYPAELFRASLQVQQVPTAIRLFEQSFMFIHQGFQRFARWTSDKVCLFQGRETIDVRLQKPTQADDLENRHVYLQMAAGGEISRAKAYRPFGIDDPVAEASERSEEDIAIQEEQMEHQEAFERKMMGSANDQLAMAMQEQQAAQGGQPAQAGQPAPAGAIDTNVQNMDPAQTMQKAQEIAQQLLQIPQDGERSKQLQQIRATNETLHSAVKQKMEELRSQAASQGRAQAGQMG